LGGGDGSGVIFSFDTATNNESVLYSFNTLHLSNPLRSLIQSGTTLYGLASNIFSFNTTTNTASLLYAFGGRPDGSGPHGSLTQIGSTLYGMCTDGGANSDGTIFSYNLLTNTETVLHSFAGSPTDGNSPGGSLTQSGTILYGMTSGGGSNSRGAVFDYDTSNSTYNVLHSFDGSDGAGPAGDLLLDRSVLYGMTNGGGPNGDGTVFAFNTITDTITNLHSFQRTDGADPEGDLVLDDNALYGMTREGGTTGAGVIFSITIPEPATVSLISAIAATALLHRPRRLLA